MSQPIAAGYPLFHGRIHRPFTFGAEDGLIVIDRFTNQTLEQG